MSDLIFNEPCILTMDILEADEYVPSVKMLVNFEIKKGGKCYRYNNAGLWFDCRSWDEFVALLAKFDSHKIAVLNDISESFSMRIENNSEKGLSFELKCSESGDIMNLVKIEFGVGLSEEQFSQVQNAFADFPKWW